MHKKHNWTEVLSKYFGKIIVQISDKDSKISFVWNETMFSILSLFINDFVYLFQSKAPTFSNFFVWSNSNNSLKDPLLSQERVQLYFVETVKASYPWIATENGRPNKDQKISKASYFVHKSFKKTNEIFA